jgi:hypothetical protein
MNTALLLDGLRAAHEGSPEGDRNVLRARRFGRVFLLGAPPTLDYGDGFFGEVAMKKFDHCAAASQDGSRRAHGQQHA